MLLTVCFGKRSIVEKKRLVCDAEKNLMYFLAKTPAVWQKLLRTVDKVIAVASVM